MDACKGIYFSNKLLTLIDIGVVQQALVIIDVCLNFGTSSSGYNTFKNTFSLLQRFLGRTGKRAEGACTSSFTKQKPPKKHRKKQKECASGACTAGQVLSTLLLVSVTLNESYLINATPGLIGVHA